MYLCLRSFIKTMLEFLRMRCKYITFDDTAKLQAKKNGGFAGSVNKYWNTCMPAAMWITGWFTGRKLYKCLYKFINIMKAYLSKKLDKEQLERLAFSKWSDYWTDIDNNVMIYELLNGEGFQQFVFDDNQQQKFSFGVPLKSVGDLMVRYKSITGYDARYWTGRLPITGQ